MTRPTPFTTILIANRGEIALRIMRTARRLGFGTVAIYSTADANARHVHEADRAAHVGGSLPSQSYLNIASIVAAARDTGADAVHPGYGFLAENEDFAAACQDAGLVFIGPSADTIRAMGNKAEAKRLMRATGVPCLPGYDGADQDDSVLADEAARVGFPVMIKATAGGGGRGMRLAPDASSFLDLLRSARSEAESAFGDGGVILERAIAAPRHIEIQIVADRYGHAIHLGERDCSVQRRHQKLIEETPSPALSPQLRERMGAIAVSAVKAIGYEGVGTLEFLLDGTQDFYFMEMNTRLQVEHPVTEAITGLDLVELQLMIAGGERLSLRQEDVRYSGHAIEVRLCAEDTAKGFLPQSGRMTRWRMPPDLRVEHALRCGDEIPPFYDSMIAKLIASGGSRDEARQKLERGLQTAIALGVKTNQQFLARCLAHPVFVAGGATTDFIGRHDEDLINRDTGDAALRATVAAVLLHATMDSGSHPNCRDVYAASFPIPMRLDVDGEIVLLRLTSDRSREYLATFERGSYRIDLVSIESDTARLRIGNALERAVFGYEGARLCVRFRDETFFVQDRTREAANPRGAVDDGTVRTSMSGRVAFVLVKVGQQVEAGQPLVTLEAMKMEHVHTAPIAGTVATLNIGEGEQVEANRVLAEISRG